jgi:hypothetical protein
MGYKEMVTGHLESAADAGMTRQEIARKLGLRSGNYVSMLMSSAYPTALLAPTRVPALARLCGLTAIQRLALFCGRVKDHPANPMVLDVETFDYLLHTAVKALEEHRAGAVGGKGALHGG